MKNLLRRLRKNADPYVCHYRRQRRIRLPSLDPRALFPDFDERAVTLQRLPQGGWSTPLADLAVLLKFVACQRPARVLEVGSFRGFTALLIAQHLPEASRVVAVDMIPDHGEAYRGTEYEKRIERRVVTMGPGAFAGDDPGSFDLAFIDADHTYAGVARDTELVLPLIAPNGYVLWHDYANWGYLDRCNGVPEFLNVLGNRLPLGHMPGTSLVVHSPAWAGAAAETYRAATAATAAGPWASADFRG